MRYWNQMELIEDAGWLSAVENMVARDGITQHYTIPPIPLTGIYLDPRLEITRHLSV